MWWQNDDGERYFLETTNRDDLGVDLQAPKFNDHGKPTAAYALVEHARDGDVVFHYQMPHGLVAWSRVNGSPFEDRIIWGARGKAAQLAGVVPYPRPGWRVMLDGPYPLERPVGLDELRRREHRIKRAVEQTERAVAGAIYRPFQLSDKQALRATQSYLTKLPRSVVHAIPELARAAAHEEVTRALAITEMAPTPGDQFGREYSEVAELVSSGEREPFDVDPSVIDRGVEGHAYTQNRLAGVVLAAGWRPVSPRPSEPQYDVAWRASAGLFVAEVKSLTEANEERQLRLGLGQVLRYRHVLAVNDEKVTAVLAVERQPTDPTWLDLCAALGVVLCWAPDFESLNT